MAAERRRDPDGLRLLRAARTRPTLDVDEAARDAVERATRMLGATKPTSERLTIVLDPYVTAQFLGIVGGTLSAEAVLKGRSLFADRVGEDVASPLLTFVDDPPSRARTPPRRPTARGSPPAATR